MVYNKGLLSRIPFSLRSLYTLELREINLDGREHQELLATIIISHLIRADVQYKLPPHQGYPGTDVCKKP